MKKAIALILALCMFACLLTACSAPAKDTPAPDTTATTSPETPPAAEEPAKTEEAAPAADTGVTGVLDGAPVPSLEGKTIGVAVLGTDHEFDLLAYQGQIDRIKELGGTPVALDGERDDTKHIADIENLILQEPDAIIKQLGDASIYEPVMKKVSEAGIPLFTVDLASQYSICNSTSDNYAIGATLARTMYELMGGEGKVAVFNGFYGVRVCAIRYDMMKYVANDYPNVEFIDPELQDVITGAADDAYKQTLDLLTKEPDVKAIWTAWDTPCTGIVRALEEAGRTDVMVFSVDGSSNVLKLMGSDNSPMACDMAQDAYTIGVAAVDQCARYLAGQSVPSTVYVEPVMVTKANYSISMKELGWE